MYFQEQNKDFGEIYENSHVDIEFLKTADAPAINLMLPDCGSCTQIMDFRDKVIIRFSAGNIPEQIIEAGESFQIVDKGCTIGFIDGQQVRLDFTGKVKRA